MDDVELLAAIADGDSNALKELFDRHAGWIATRLRVSLPPHAVEDVVQESFIAVWKGAARYRHTGAPAAWIWGIARRQAALWLRQHHRPDVVLDALDTMETGLNPADQATIRADLDAALKTLGDPRSDDRRLAHLAFVEEQPVKEIARRLNIPVGTVKSRVFALRRRLKSALIGENDDREES